MDIFKKCAMYLSTEKKSSKKFAGEMWFLSQNIEKMNKNQQKQE